MAPPTRRTDAQRSVKFKALYDFIIDLTLGTKGVIDEGTAAELYDDGGTKGKIARTLLKERITYEDVVNMVYDWAAELDSETRGWSYSPTELMIKRAPISDEKGNFLFEVRVRNSDSIEASIDAILSNAFVNPTPEDINNGWDKWHWQGFGLVDGILESDESQDPIIEGFTNRKELDLTTYFIDKGVNAYLSTDSQIGQFINQVTPILFPTDHGALARHLYQDGTAWQNLANSWPQILAAIKLEEATNTTPNLRRGIGKVIEEMVDPDSDYGWIPTIFGPSEMLPDTPREFINEDEWISYRARANATFQSNKSIIDDPLSVLRSLLPGDNELKERYGSWAVTSKKSFLENWEGHIENLAESLGIEIDPETGDYTRAAGMMLDRLSAIWQNEETGWLSHLANSERLHYQDSSARKKIIDDLLFSHGYAPDRISDEARLQLSQRLAMMGDVELFKRTYSKEVIDQYVQTRDYSQYLEEFGSWDLVEDVVDEWLASMGGMEVTDARKYEMIKTLYQDMPSLEEFTDSPENKQVLFDKLNVEFGADSLDFAYEKRNQDIVASDSIIPEAIRDIFGMDANMQLDNPELYAALEGKGRLRLEGMIREEYSLDPDSSKTPSDYAAEFMQTRGITPSGDIGKYPRVWTGTEYINYEPEGGFAPDPMPVFPADPRVTEEFNYLGGEGFSFADIMGYQAAQRAFDVPTSREELNADYIRRLEEAGLPQAIIDFESRRITDEFQKAMVEEQLQSGRPPQIPEEFINFARDYGTETIPAYDFLGNIETKYKGVSEEAARVRDEVIAMRQAWENITDPAEKARQQLILENRERVADELEALEGEKDFLIAQQVGDPTFARLTDADFPTREALLGGIRDEFSGSAAGRAFIDRQIAEGNIDFSDIDARLGEIRQREGIRHHQTRPTDPMALVPSFTQQQLPTLAQDFAQEQQEERARRGELTGLGSTIFRRRTL